MNSIHYLVRVLLPCVQCSICEAVLLPEEDDKVVTAVGLHATQRRLSCRIQVLARKAHTQKGIHNAALVA